MPCRSSLWCCSSRVVQMPRMLGLFLFFAFPFGITVGLPVTLGLFSFIAFPFGITVGATLVRDLSCSEV